MKPATRFSVYILGLLLPILGSAQKPLPDFSVRELAKGKIQVSWNNPYPSCIQLAVQRSTDSSKNFRTIFSAQSPELPSNGFVDNRPPAATKWYYRIFYVLLGGDYYFSKVISITSATTPIVKEQPDIKTGPTPKIDEPAVKTDIVSIYLKKSEIFRFTRDEYKKFRDSVNTKTKDGLRRINNNSVEWKPSEKKYKKEQILVFRKDGVVRAFSKKGYQKFKDSVFYKTRDTLFAVDDRHKVLHLFVPKQKEYISIYRNDSLLMQVDNILYKKFRDSISFKTRDTLYQINNSRVDIHSFIPKYVWKPSVYVYTNLQGYVSISLPLARQHKYHIIFYDDDGSELFRIKTIRETELVLDKANFIHAGWFTFDLFEDDRLIEKNKFKLQKN